MLYVDPHSARFHVPAFLLLVTTILPSTLALAAQSIPEDQIDDQQVYWGSPVQFDTPGEVDFDAVLEATSEYKKIRQEKIQRDTAKYWILLGNATNRAIRAIAEVADESGYDLVTKKGYLLSLDPPIPSEDITKLVLKKL